MITDRFLFDSRYLNVFFLGFISGFPWVLIGSVMTLWLQQIGLSRSAIGYFGSIFVVYALNFLWAPLLDRVKIPFFSRHYGQRRSWILICLMVIAPATWLISLVDPNTSLLMTSVIALTIAIASATQDISIDAYRIEIFGNHNDSKLSYAAAAATSGWWAGYGFLGGSFALFLGGETVGLSWSEVYSVLTLVVLGQFMGVLLIREPESQRDVLQHQAEIKYQQQISKNHLATWMMVTVIDPLVEFFRRCGWPLALALIAFVLTFKLGEAFLGRMSIVFYKEVGFTVDQINLYSKFGGGILTVIFSFLGAMLNTRMGVVKGLMVGGCAMAMSNFLFSWIASVGPNTNLLALAILVDGFTAAFATVAFMAFISYFTSQTYTATQYALLASLGNLGRTTLAANSGAMVDFLDDWSVFFAMTALMVIPSLIILRYIHRLLKTKKEHVTESATESGKKATDKFL